MDKKELTKEEENLIIQTCLGMVAGFLDNGEEAILHYLKQSKLDKIVTARNIEKLSKKFQIE